MLSHSISQAIQSGIANAITNADYDWGPIKSEDLNELCSLGFSTILNTIDSIKERNQLISENDHVE